MGKNPAILAKANEAVVRLRLIRNSASCFLPCTIRSPHLCTLRPQKASDMESHCHLFTGDSVSWVLGSAVAKGSGAPTHILSEILDGQEDSYRVSRP